MTAHQIHGGIASTRLPGLPPPPSGAPTLSGRLMPVRLPNGVDFDLFWKAERSRADGKPSFRFKSEQNQLLVLSLPNAKNVADLFDCASEAGIGMPKIQITGTPEFQRLAAAEAAKRGLPIDTKDMDEPAVEIYRQTFSEQEQHGEAANSITSGAYESQHRDEQRRIAEAAAAAAKNDQGDGEDDGDRRPGGPRS